MGFIVFCLLGGIVGIVLFIAFYSIAIVNAKWQTKDYWYLKTLAELLDEPTTKSEHYELYVVFGDATNNLKSVLKKQPKGKLRDLAIAVYKEFTKCLRCYLELGDLDVKLRNNDKIKSRKESLEYRFNQAKEALDEIMVHVVLAESDGLITEDQGEDVLDTTRTHLRSIEEIEDWLVSI